MNKIDQYTIVKQLFSSTKYTIYQAIGDKSEAVILKVISKEFVSAKAIASIMNEYNIIREFSSPLIVEALKIIHHENAPVMVLKDIGGMQLKQFIKENASNSRTHDIEKALEIAILITKAIGQIHEKNIIHKDINPNNIIYNPKTKFINIIDFNLSSKLNFEKQEISNNNLLEGTLAYISPEQTGRINRNLDYRTDFYSLGVTLYELFSSCLPFEAQTLREWIHCQIAISPIPLHKLNREIPEAISQIVSKLMEKSAENRYQSSFGIVEDLQRCLYEFSTKGRIDTFEAGKNNVSQKFQLSQKLYGREKEVELLMKQFKELKKYNSTTVLVKGFPGIGKTALVGEISKEVNEENGYIVSGKFELLKRDIPYFAFIDVFSRLFQILISEPEDMILSWSEKLKTALAGNGQAIIDLIPNLELLIGTQPSLPQLSAIESQNRFVFTFQKLVRVIADTMHPLVIYLDDLQWADNASLDLLKALLSNNQNGALLFIGAYRNNEVTEGHPVQIFQHELQKEHINHIEIELLPLQTDSIKELIKDSFACQDSNARELAEICFAKTHGNPFFIIEFLNNLYRKNQIRFDPEIGSWTWQLEEIQNTNVTENVVDLICSRIQELEQSKQSIIKYAACIGSQFDLDLLSAVSDIGKKNLGAEINAILQESLIIPLSNDYRFSEYQDELQMSYRFMHDRILQAAYSMISDASKAATHLKIAKLLKDKYADNEVIENIFVITEHFNKVIDLLDENEKVFVAKLNLNAGKRAKSSSAFHEAYRYLEIGHNLLPQDKWQKQYQLSLEIHSQLAEISFLRNKRQKMKTMLNEIFLNTQSILDKIDAWETHLLSLNFDHQYKQSIADGLDFLNQLKVKIPQKVTKVDLILALIKTRTKLKKFSYDKILNLPNMEDEHAQASFRIMSMLITPSYYANPNLFPMLAFRFVELTIKYGLSNLSPLGFIMYGMVINVATNNLEKCYNYGKLGMNILAKLNDKKYWANTSCIYNASIRIWKEPLKNSIDGFYSDYQISLDTGNIEFATTSTAVNISYQLFVGGELNDLYLKFSKYQEFLSQWPKQPNGTLLNVFLQVIDNLQNKKDAPEILLGKHCDENKISEENKIVNDHAQMASMYVYKLMLAFIFERYSEANIINDKLSNYIVNIKGLLNYPVFLFFQSLLLLRNYEILPANKKKSILKKASNNLKKFKKWADKSESNFLGKSLLIEAEIERVRNHCENMTEKFNQAIWEASKQGDLLLEAMACEIFAKYFVQKKNTELAKVYFTKSYEAYKHWNASAKVAQIENRYAGYISSSKNKRNIESELNSLQLESASDFIDIETLMDSAKTISSEVKISELLKKTLKTLMVHAGAAHGCLLLYDKVNSNLQIEAEGKIENGEIIVSLNKSQVSDQVLPVSVIQFVARTQKTIILGNAMEDPNHSKNPYILKNELKSVLSAPIIHQSELIGILYLENNLTPNVFTKKHLNIVNLLSAQIGISIVNAFLYENLEKIVEERTAQIKIQAEELKLKNEKLQIMDEFKTAMTGMIVHDLKNPLNSIINIQHDNSEKQIDRIVQSGKQMLTLVMNILDVHKYEDTEVILNKSHCSLLKIMQHAIKGIHVLADEKNINIHCVNCHDIMLEADKDILERMLINLFTNAIKFTPINGTIQINISITKKVKEQGKDFVKVSISDSGVGIPEDKLDLVFQKYGQVQSRNSGQIRSTGLGLTFCKMMAEAHGGEIGVESKVDKGSTFWFTIPYIDSYDSEKSEINLNIPNKKYEFSFSEREKEILLPLIHDLKNVMVYESGEVSKILKAIDTEDSENLNTWKQEIQNCLYSMNEQKYNELLNLL